MYLSKVKDVRKIFVFFNINRYENQKKYNSTLITTNVINKLVYQMQQKNLKYVYVSFILISFIIYVCIYFTYIVIIILSNIHTLKKVREAAKKNYYLKVTLT